MKRFIDWLGRGRVFALVVIIGGTGALSLLLQAVGSDVAWVIPAQNALLLIALAGTVIVMLGRLDPLDRRPLIVAFAPLMLGLALGLFLPEFTFWFLGAGIGWLIISLVVLRRNVRREYQQAIRHLRRAEYEAAIGIIDRLIQAEPGDTRHFRFRADLYRLKGDLKRALKDYHRIVDLEPQSSVGYNGLAEICLQQGKYDEALIHARAAYERDPRQWAMPYNLGMIEDRLGMAEEAIGHLREALDCGVSDSRHRLLVHLWLGRAYARLGRTADAAAELAALRREKRGLDEWQTIFASEQSRTLQEVLAGDIALARAVFDGAGEGVFAVAGDAAGAAAVPVATKEA